MFGRKGWVYLLAAQSAWDSAYYSTFYVAAPSVKELASDSRTRIAGRFLIPSQGQSFGSGQVIQVHEAGDEGGGGVGGKSGFAYVHHHLNNTACVKNVGVGCARDVWQTPIQFEDRNDGRGDIYIVPVFPAERSDSVEDPLPKR